MRELGSKSQACGRSSSSRLYSGGTNTKQCPPLTWFCIEMHAPLLKICPHTTMSFMSGRVWVTLRNTGLRGILHLRLVHREAQGPSQGLIHPEFEIYSHTAPACGKTTRLVALFSHFPWVVSDHFKYLLCISKWGFTLSLSKSFFGSVCVLKYKNFTQDIDLLVPSIL